MVLTSSLVEGLDEIFGHGFNSIHKPPAADENLKGSTVTTKAYLMGVSLIDAGGL